MSFETKKSILERQIRRIFINHPSDQFTRNELMVYLNVEEVDYDLVHKILTYLSDQGFLHRTRQDHGNLESIPIMTYYYRLICDHRDENFNQHKAVMVTKRHYKRVNVPLNSQDSGFSKTSAISESLEIRKLLAKRYIDQDKKEYLYHYDIEKNRILIFLAPDKSNSIEYLEIAIGDPIVGIEDVYLCYAKHYKKRSIGLIITGVKEHLARKSPREKDIYKLVRKTLDLYYFPGRIP